MNYPASVANAGVRKIYIRASQAQRPSNQIVAIRRFFRLGFERAALFYLWSIVTIFPAPDLF